MKSITKLLPFLITLIMVSFLSGCGGSNTKDSRVLTPSTLDETAISTLATNLQDDVTPVTNRPPQAFGQSFRINSGVEYLGELRASDEDNDSLTFTIVNEPVNGTLLLNENGTFKYISTKVGVDSFSFYVSDGILQSQEQTVDITLSQDDISVPNTPLNLTVTRVDETTALLQWQDNSDDEVLFAILDENYNLLKVVDADINETNITGLVPTVDYTFMIKSRNSAGHVGSAQTTLLKLNPDDILNVGTIIGTVKDLSADKNPLVGASVSIYVGDKFLKSVVTDIDGGFILEDVSSLAAHKIIVSKDGYLDGMYYDIMAITNDTVVLDTILQIRADQSGVGRVGGKISNAINGVGIDTLHLNVRRGINVKSGDVVATTTTDGDGYYEFLELDAGNYTLEVIGEGFITGYFTVVSVGDKNSDNQNFSITPILLDGEFRIVLTWGESPKDLDSHLTGPLEDSDERFHVSFRAKGSQVTSPYSFLDLDDTIKYGPETITIKEKKEGVYRYSVLDYTNARSSFSSALGNSGAKVKVYKGSNLVHTFNVPNQEGVFWAVFDIVGDEIVPINRVQYVKEYDPVD